MSIKLMSVVWDMDLAPGEKLVLLALADQANDEGRQCWPSVETIARRSGQSVRTVRRMLSSLEEAGHLTRIDRSGTSNAYHIHPCQNDTPANLSGLPKSTETPANLTPKTPVTIKPNPKRAHARARARISPDFVPSVPPDGETARAIDGWPPGRLDSEIERFRDHHLSKGTESLDWDASFRTWIKNARKFDERDKQQSGLSRAAASAVRVFGLADGA